MKTLQNLSEFYKRLITGFFLITLFGGAYILSSHVFSLLLVLVTGIIMFFEWPKLIEQPKVIRGVLSNPLYIIIYPISSIYPSATLVGLIRLTHLYYESNPLIPMYPFLVAWTADTCGYLVGKCCGKHKMCPTISPGKTWEGFVGSLGGVLTLHFFIYDALFFYPHSTHIVASIAYITIISLIMTCIAFLGGFFLSWLKRRKKIKDAGWILPGHGGMLDRFDGVLAVTLAVMVLLLFHALT